MLLLKISGRNYGAAAFKEVKIDDAGKQVLLTFHDDKTRNLTGGQYVAFMTMVRDGTVKIVDLGDP